MIPQSHTAESWKNVLEWIDQFHNARWIFRGVTSKDYELLPKVGRPSAFGKHKYSIPREKELFRRFRQYASAYLPAASDSEDLKWRWLAIAQHHGLPTRLLDWTQNPLVATYFAVQDDKEACQFAMVYALSAPEAVKTNIDKDPFEDKVRKERTFIPPMSHRGSPHNVQYLLSTLPRPYRCLTGAHYII